VVNGVFDQRLKNKGGDSYIQRSGIDLLLNPQPFTEAGLLYFQIQIEKFHFTAQRHFMLLRGVERHPKEIAEGTNHVLGGAWLSAHE
jgi:hypothetical protein